MFSSIPGCGGVSPIVYWIAWGLHWQHRKLKFKERAIEFVNKNTQNKIDTQWDLVHDKRSLIAVLLICVVS